MNKQLKALSILLYILWPISALVIGVKNFDTSFGRKLLIAVFVFLGYTANDTGDLERYASQYYGAIDNKLSYLVDLFLNLEVGKFFIDFTALLFSVFESHHIYFAFLFGFYGYFLVNSINLIRIKVLKRSNRTALVAFITFALFFSILTVFNYAFYTGAIYFIYFLLQIILNKNNKKYFLFIVLTPLFHLGLTPLLIVPIVFVLFKQRTIFYVLLLIVFTALSQALVINIAAENLVDKSTVLDSKFNAYASEVGQERMEERYSTGYETGNLNYRFFRDIRTITNKIAIPILFFIFFINRNKFRDNEHLCNLFNLSIACLAITQLMLNISQGERFYFLSGFMILAVCAYYLQLKKLNNLKFKFLIYLIIPVIFLNNLVSLYLVKNLINPDFLLSNIPFSLYNLL